ncbi:MAG: site-specific integrase [Terracidiphilus sp.]
MLIYQSITPELLFPEAFRLWLAHHTLDGATGSAGYLSPRSVRDYKACSRALEKFFGRLRLSEIHAGHMREYQRARTLCDHGSAAWERPCGPNRIRKELALLIRVLRAAHLWGEAQEVCFQMLRPVENDVPRAMQPEEQMRFLAAAASRVEWQMIYWYSIVALQTTASTNELRALRMGDVMLGQGILQIRREGAKNKYRIRTIPLETPEVVWALENLIARARELGAGAPHHYLFPIQAAKGYYDPLRPMSDSGLKKRWNAVRAAAGVPWLRPYDLRHTAITRMAEAGTPIQVIMSFAGHMTLRMQQHYTAISMMAKRKWARSTWEEPGAEKLRRIA